MEFPEGYPAILYEVEEGKYAAYAPPIPVKDEGVAIFPGDIPRVGSYPDRVTRSLARQRDRTDQQLLQTTQELKWHKKQEKEQGRLVELWRQRYVRATAGRHHQASTSKKADAPRKQGESEEGEEGNVPPFMPPNPYAEEE